MRDLIRAELRRRDEEEAALAAAPAPVPQGKFTPTNSWSQPWPQDMLAESFTEAFWDQFEKKPLTLSKRPWVSPKKLRKIARKIKFPDTKLVEEVAQMLEKGAATGVRGPARLPLRPPPPNSQTLNGLGPQVLDSLRTWVREGVLCGPLREEELPPGAKHSPLAAVLKLTGKARSVPSPRSVRQKFKPSPPRTEHTFTYLHISNQIIDWNP